MLRGCQKQMIVLQTEDSSVFESAFFVLRRENAPVGVDDMLTEANRIIGAGVGVTPRKRQALRGALLVLLGAFLGAGALALVLLLLGFGGPWG